MHEGELFVGMLLIHTHVAEEGRCICACKEIVDLPAVFTGCNLTDGKRRSEGKGDITTEQSLFEIGAPPPYRGQFHEERHPKRTYSFLWEHLREKQFPNHACSSRVPVIDKLCE